MGIRADVRVEGLGVGDVWDKGASVTLLQTVERAIEERPAKGERADGQPLPKYQTAGYGDSERVDLNDTGAMLESIRITRVSGRGGEIACTLRHPRAVFMNRRFPFMGILATDAQRALEAAEAQHGERLATRVKLNTRKGGNAAAFSALKGLASEVQAGG